MPVCAYLKQIIPIMFCYLNIKHWDSLCFLFQYEGGLQNNLWNKNFLLTLGRGLSIKHSWLIIAKLSMHHQQTCTLINCWIFKIYKIFYSELINHHYFSIVGFRNSKFYIFSPWWYKITNKPNSNLMAVNIN